MQTIKRMVACGLLLALSACRAAAAPASTATPTESIPATRFSPEPQAARYVNQDAGLSLVLPPGWTAAGPFDAAAGDAAYALYVLGLDPALEGGPGASRLIVAADNTLSIQSFLAAQCSTCPDHGVTDAQLNGIPVQRAVLGGGGVPFEIEWVFLEHDGRLVGLAIHDPATLETLNPVLDTLELLP